MNMYGDPSIFEVVFENDGSVIDEDEILLEIPKESLMLLAPSQLWTPAVQQEANEPVGPPQTPAVKPECGDETEPQPGRSEPVTIFVEEIPISKIATDNGNSCIKMIESE